MHKGDKKEEKKCENWGRKNIGRKKTCAKASPTSNRIASSWGRVKLKFLKFLLKNGLLDLPADLQANSKLMKKLDLKIYRQSGRGGSWVSMWAPSINGAGKKLWNRKKFMRSEKAMEQEINLWSRKKSMEQEAGIGSWSQGALHIVHFFNNSQ